MKKKKKMKPLWSSRRDWIRNLRDKWMKAIPVRRHHLKTRQCSSSSSKSDLNVGSLMAAVALAWIITNVLQRLAARRPRSVRSQLLSTAWAAKTHLRSFSSFEFLMNATKVERSGDKKRSRRIRLVDVFIHNSLKGDLKTKDTQKKGKGEQKKINRRRVSSQKAGSFRRPSSDKKSRRVFFFSQIYLALGVHLFFPLLLFFSWLLSRPLLLLLLLQRGRKWSIIHDTKKYPGLLIPLMPISCLFFIFFSFSSNLQSQLLLAI